MNKKIFILEKFYNLKYHYVTNISHRMKNFFLMIIVDYHYPRKFTYHLIEWNRIYQLIFILHNF